MQGYHEEELDPEAPPLASTSHNNEVKTGPKDWIPVEDEVVMAVKKEMKPDGLSSLGSQALIQMKTFYPEKI